MTPQIDLAACLVTPWQVTPDLGLRLAVIIGLAVLAGWSDAQRYFPGKRAFFWLNVVLAAWIAATTAEHAAVSAGCKTTLALLAWPAIVVLPPLWTLFLHQHVGSETRKPRSHSVAWVVLGIAMLSLAALSNGLHGLFYGPGTTLGEPILGLPRMRYEYGALFFLAAAWGYAWLLAATVIVLQAIRQATPQDRPQWLMFLAMMMVPWASNVGYLAFGVRLFGGDPTPLSFAIAVVGFGWLVRNNSLFKVIPLSRRLLFVALPDPVLVLDSLGRVTDINLAARKLAGGDGQRGQPLQQWPVFGESLAARLAQPGEVATPLLLEGGALVFDVRVSQIGEGDRFIGQLVQLRDVTAQHQAQARIAGTLAERDEQLRQVTRLESELRDQALRDPLTGLLNRRALAQRFDQEWHHQQATGQALTLVLIDIDHFKQINDNHGHAAGDAVLRAFGATLRDAVRTSDAVFRIGGEEFALLLPNAHTLQATLRVDDLRQRARAMSLPVVNTGLSFSAGVAACTTADDSLEALMRRADAALYRAKAAGRDQTIVASGG